MATMGFATWLQASDLARINQTNHLIMIFIGLVAVAMTIMAIAMIVVSVITAKAVKGVMATVEEVKGKALPLIDTATEIGKTSQALLRDLSPKVKVVADNIVEASENARSAARQTYATVTDVNLRTQRQVERVDGMVTATLATTAEVAEAISQGIRVNVQKIAGMAAQARYGAEGLLSKIKAMAEGTPFGRRKDPTRP